MRKRKQSWMLVPNRIRASSSEKKHKMNIKIENTVSATAYVVTGALAMITAEVPIRNMEEESVEYSVYDQIISPEGAVLTTTESRGRLGAGAEETILDELLRVRDPQNELQGYKLRVLLRVGDVYVDSKEVEIKVV